MAGDRRSGGLDGRDGVAWAESASWRVGGSVGAFGGAGAGAALDRNRG